MATTVTVTKPAGIVAVHATSKVRYHRFETGVTSANLQDTSDDNTTFSGTSVTFSAGSGTITPTFPSGLTHLHVILSNGHYYRFESSGQVTLLQNGDVTGSFSTISFTTA